VGAKEISNKKSSCWLRLCPEKGSDVEKIIQINLTSDISGEQTRETFSKKLFLLKCPPGGATKIIGTIICAEDHRAYVAR